MSQESKLLTFVLDAGLILAIITSFLYFVGTAYYYGYLDEWGIENSLLTKPFHQTIFLGFVVISQTIANLFIYFFIVFIFVASVVVLYSSKINLTNKESVKSNLGTSELNKKTKSITLFLACFGSILIIFQLILTYFSTVGANFASSQIDDFKQDKLDPKEIIQIKDPNNNFIDILIVDCSEILCVAIDTNNKELIFFVIKNQNILKGKKIKI